MLSKQPLVSVIVPVYNNERYVVPCMRSLLAQTLEDIEVICINDGSTDNSSKVLHAFADDDDRVRVIDKENGGYGVGINRGLDEARGKYVTILESDDFADVDMLETLVGYAEAFELEVVRANFYLYWSSKLKKDALLELFAPFECDRVIDPSIRENQHCFYVQPALWSAIYRTDFIRDNRLRLLETPGAAYQDTAFNFKIWACARRVMFVHKAFVHYRQDNESSSINNPGKVYNICLEYRETDRWLREDRPDLRKNLAPVMWKMMCDAYTWNTGRVSKEYKLDFVKEFGRELAKAEAAGEIDKSLFAPGQYAIVSRTMTDPQAFIDFQEKGIDPDRGLSLYRRKLSTAAQIWSQRGIGDVLQIVHDKLTSHPFAPTDVARADAELIQTHMPAFHATLPAATSPEVSVVMPVYNCADVLPQTLDSLLGQEFDNFELICVNDGSTDGSLDVLNRYAKKDARIRVVSQTNGGAGSARNAGMRLARAPYLMLLDADDIYDYRLIGTLHDRIEATGADVCVCASCQFRTGDFGSWPATWALKTSELPKGPSFTPQEAGDAVFTAFLGWPWDRIFRTSYVRESGITFPALANSEDAPFCYELLAGAGRLAYVNEILIRHRVGREDSVSNARLKAPEEFYKAIILIRDYLLRTGIYPTFKHGFLAWAFDYTLWNIITLPQGETRTTLIKKLFEGGFPELEIDKHPIEYFELLPETAERYEELKKMYDNLSR